MRVTLLLVLGVLAWAGDVAVVADFTAPKAGDLLTWHLTGVPAAWLQADVAHTPRLTVAGPDGTVWTRRSYLDQEWTTGPAAKPVGEPFLSVRHAARLPGKHRWTLWNPDGKAVATGEVAVAESTAPAGPIGLSKANLRLLAWADGTPFVAIGPNLGWAATPDRAADFARYCGILKANGCTHVRIWLSSWSGKVIGDKPDVLRLDHAKLMDRQLAAARSAGIAVTMVLDNFYDLLEGKSAPYGATRDERIRNFVDAGPDPSWLRAQAYCLARWGADDTILAWEPMNEVDMLQPVRERALPWAQAALAWLRKEDQDHRLLTLSWAGEDWARAMALPNVDIAQVRGYVHEWTDADWRLIERSRDAIALFRDPFAEAQQLGKPWLLAEVGYQGSETNNRGNELDTGGLLLRQSLWSGFLLGGCGGGMNWWWDVHVDRQNLWGAYLGFSRCVARLDWKDRELVPLTPNSGGAMRVLGWAAQRQALLWPSHVNDTWYAHVAQGKTRPRPIQPVAVGLGGFAKASSFRVTPLDMLSGEPRQAWEQRSDKEGRLDLVIPPGTIDTVYWVEKIDEKEKKP